MSRPLAIALLCCLGLLGCGSGTTPYRPTPAYTPASLAQELSFRYEKMAPVSRPKPLTSLRNREPAGTAEQVEAKSKVEVKAQKASSIEELVDEVAARATEVLGKEPGEVLDQIAGIIEADPKIKEADRRLMADRLRKSK